MKLALVFVLGMLGTAVADPAADLATAASWVKDAQTAVDVAVGHIGASFRQVTNVIGGDGCLAKFKSGAIAAKKRKAFVACAGKVFEEIAPSSEWKIVDAAGLEDGYKAFAKLFPKSSRFVRTTYSEGFIFVVLGEAKDGPPFVIGLWIDRSGAG